MNFWRLGEHNFHKDFIRHNRITMDYFNYYDNWSKNYLENIKGGGITSFRKWLDIKKGDVIFLCTKFQFLGVCIALEEYNKDNVRDFTANDNKTYWLPGILVKFIVPPTNSFDHTFDIKLTTPATFTKASTHGFSLEGLKKLLKAHNRKAYYEIFPRINKSEINSPTKSEETFNKFKFIPGGHSRNDSETRKYSAKEKRKIKKLHNEIQTNVVKQLIREYNASLISSENKAGGRRSIDVVRKKGDKFVFYEIKVYEKIRLCIREALGQLLEYAHWTQENLIEEIVIVSQNSISQNTHYYKYLRFMREVYKINVNYQRYNLQIGVLEDPIF